LPVERTLIVRTPWRITEVWQKLVYIVGGYAVFVLFFWALRTYLLDAKSLPYASIAFALNIAYTIVGVRVFRGYLEPVEPPRAWWRWTGRPKAGFWLGALNVLAATADAQDFWPRDGHSPDISVAVLNILAATVTAIGYLNSSFRLQRHPELWSSRRSGSARVASTSDH
jgi:hypothetical protein